MKILFLFFLFAGRIQAIESIELAITVDDLPASGDELPGVSRTRVANQFIDVLRHHGVPGVYGFLNGILAKHMAERMRILAIWKKAGFGIGNHTFSHKSLVKVSSQRI